MTKQNNDMEQAQGVVTEALPNTFFKVKLSDDREVMCYLAGKMRLNRIKVLIGDRVQVDIDKYGGKSRISRRF